MSLIFDKVLPSLVLTQQLRLSTNFEALELFIVRDAKSMSIRKVLRKRFLTSAKNHSIRTFQWTCSNISSFYSSILKLHAYFIIQIVYIIKNLRGMYISFYVKPNNKYVFEMDRCMDHSKTFCSIQGLKRGVSNYEIWNLKFSKVDRNEAYVFWTSISIMMWLEDDELTTKWKIKFYEISSLI